MQQTSTRKEHVPRKRLRAVRAAMEPLFMLEDEDDLPQNPCRDERCTRVGAHEVHPLPPDSRGVRPQTDVCGHCLGLVKVGQTCGCGRFKLVAVPREDRPQRTHVVCDDGYFLCHRASPRSPIVEPGATPTCHACMRLLRTWLVICPNCQATRLGECAFCGDKGYVRRYDLYADGRPVPRAATRSPAYGLPKFPKPR